MTIRISLNEENFTDLISGKVISIPVNKYTSGEMAKENAIHNVQITLQDIGYYQMVEIIHDAMAKNGF